MDETIRTEALVKNFGRTRALDGLDLVVHTGEVHGFLGPNGAGKTTTLRVLLGLLRRTGGRPGCSGATRGPRRPSCTAAWPTSPGMSPSGRTSPAGR
jgi:ABC-type multidrug transport system ATPase subunit